MPTLSLTTTTYDNLSQNRRKGCILSLLTYWASAWQNLQNDVCSPKSQISLGMRPVWSVFNVHMKKIWVLSKPLSAQQNWSDWVDAQADLSSLDAHAIL